MTSEGRRDHELEEQQIAMLVRDAWDCPAMDRGFAEALGANLDAQFEQLRRERQAIVQIEHARPNPRRRRSRWGWTLATAASIAVVLSIFGNRPSYSWEQMIEALRSQTWIQTNSMAGGSRVVRWVSAIRGVFAKQSDDRAELADQNKRVLMRYQRADGEIVQDELKPGPVEETPSAKNPLPPALAELLTPLSDATNGGKPADVTVIDQNWQRTEDNMIELQVSLQVEGPQPRTVRADFTISPDTHLPVSCRIVDEQGSTSDANFSYPTEGPENIYSLGAPKEAEVRLASVPKMPTESLAKIVPKTPEEMPAKEPEEKEPEEKPAEMPEAKPAPPEVAKTDNSLLKVEQPATIPAEKTPEPQVITSPDELVAKVDSLLDEKWSKLGIKATEPATDEEYLRRVSLDLVGHVPSVGEVRMFLEDSTDGRRQRWVESLLKSRDHATYFAGLWRRILIPEGVNLAPFGGGGKLEEWLANHFQKNTPYDRIVSDLLLAEGRITQSGPLLFYAALKLNPEELAAQTSRVFLGLRLECAQCHNHPFDERISQEDFWSYAALFARISRPQGKIEIVSPVMQVRDNARGEVTLPNTDKVVPPRLPFTKETVTDAENGASRRRQLVDWLRSPKNPQMATATVNRVWAHLFGRGLVEPVDDIRAQNPCVSPEVLDLLARDFIEHQFDLRRLIRCLISTKAYQLSSRSEDDGSARSAVFAQMNLKPFTAEQLYDCIAVVARSATMTNMPRGQAELFRLGNTSREAFIELFHVPAGRAVDYQAGIPQALTLMHGQLIHNATDWNTSGAMKSLSAPFFTDQQRIEMLFLATMSRMPTTEEGQRFMDYVGQSADRKDRQQRLGDVLWALLNSAEFTMNH